MISQAGSTLIAAINGPHGLIMEKLAPHVPDFIHLFARCLNSHDLSVGSFRVDQNWSLQPKAFQNWQYSLVLRRGDRGFVTPSAEWTAVRLNKYGKYGYSPAEMGGAVECRTSNLGSYGGTWHAEKLNRDVSISFEVTQ